MDVLPNALPFTWLSYCRCFSTFHSYQFSKMSDESQLPVSLDVNKLNEFVLVVSLTAILGGFTSYVFMWVQYQHHWRMTAIWPAYLCCYVQWTWRYVMLMTAMRPAYLCCYVQWRWRYAMWWMANTVISRNVMAMSNHWLNLILTLFLFQWGILETNFGV